jgi:four helix bundle protein
MSQVYKFEKLEVWQLSLELSDIVYELDKLLPISEQFNLSSQIKRAVTSISLNIAEGSTNSSKLEFAMFLRISIRSYLEVYACFLLIKRRGFISPNMPICNSFEELGSKLFAKLQALLKSIN